MKNLFESNRPLKLTIIGFIVLFVGAFAVPKEPSFQIPFIIGTGASFVMALYFVLRKEEPIPSGFL